MLNKCSIHAWWCWVFQMWWSAKLSQNVLLQVRLRKLLLYLFYHGVNPILHGLLEIPHYMGGGLNQNDSPPIKIHLNDSNLAKRHVLAKVDYFCPSFMHLELKNCHFWPLKETNNKCVIACIEGSHFWIVSGKNCWHKNFWKYQKETPKMAKPGPL